MVDVDYMDHGMTYIAHCQQVSTESNVWIDGSTRKPTRTLYQKTVLSEASESSVRRSPAA